jgi:WD40 repeat protein
LVQAPANAGKGTAKVALSFDAWKPGAVQPATVDVPVHVIEATDSPQLRAILKGHENFVWQVAWAPDGKTLATLSTTGSELKLWDVAERKERATLRSGLGDSYGLAFTPDGRTLVVGHYRNDAKAGPSGGISLFDAATGQRKGLLQHTPPRGVVRLALSPDGKTIAAAESWREGEKGAYNGGVTLWDVTSGKAGATLGDERTGALAFSADGKILAWSAYGIKDGRIAEARVCRRDLTNEQELPALPNTATKNPLQCLVFSPDGRTLAGSDYEGTIVLWDTASGQVRTTLKAEDRRRVSSLAFAPDGKTLAAAVGDRPGHDHEPGLIILWDTAHGQRRLTLTGHTNAVLSVAFSPDGRLLASGSSDRTVRLWDMTAPPATGVASSGR